MEVMHVLLTKVVDFAILLFELVGVLIVVASGIHGTYSYLKRDPYTKLNLAKGLAMGLEFKMGSEILRTVVVRDFSEILTVAGIIILRAALSFLIHWEIKNGEVAESEHALNKD